jgi:glucose-1-phosphate cytidylyltransferase
MKVVILAGGLGTRMREETEFRPKPMVEIGGKPAIWHLMKLYANYGHTEFVICAGYKGEQIKNYFYNYRPLSLDFTINLGEPDSVKFHGSHDEFDWKVTVVDTGLSTPTGGRVKQVEDFLEGGTFMCSYGDSIAPVRLEELIATHRKNGKAGTGLLRGFRTAELVDSFMLPRLAVDNHSGLRWGVGSRALSVGVDCCRTPRCRG